MQKQSDMTTATAIRKEHMNSQQWARLINLRLAKKYPKSTVSWVASIVWWHNVMHSKIDDVLDRIAMRTRISENWQQLSDAMHDIGLPCEIQAHYKRLDIAQNILPEGNKGITKLFKELAKNGNKL